MAKEVGTANQAENQVALSVFCAKKKEDTRVNKHGETVSYYSVEFNNLYMGLFTIDVDQSFYHVLNEGSWYQMSARLQAKAVVKNKTWEGTSYQVAGTEFNLDVLSLNAA